MVPKKRMLAVSSGLILVGSLLLVLVAALFVFGRIQAWLVAQPRALASEQIIWPDVPPLTPLPSPTTSPAPTTLPTHTPSPTPDPTPTPVPGPPVWIEIPSLGIKRAIIPVERTQRHEQWAWDVEPLFANSNRHDLVGHLEGTSNPGQLGNMVLAGHNYNRGWYNWTGVFNALGRLRPGDTIYVLNESDQRYSYRVDRVDKVPYQANSLSSVLAHSPYLGPTGEETLTLVTCGGANFAPFPSRIYVTATRAGGED